MSTFKPHRIIENRAAPNCRRVRIFLAEKGIDIPFEQIDIMAGEHFRDKHKNMVGTFRVPVLAFTNGSFLQKVSQYVGFSKNTFLRGHFLVKQFMKRR